MKKTFSIYLDLIRFTAACLVYLYHSNQRWLVGKILPASDFGHGAVIVFFVLSGFVIAYITDTRENRFTTYTASRISRIYSVAAPAILLTIALDSIGRHFYPEIYGYPFDHFFVRGAASFFVLNEIWFVSITSFSNVPYWSICYEMWYYVAFALIVFLPRRTGLIAVALLAIVLGPKVVLLAPIWGLGVFLYRSKYLAALSELTGWLLVIGSIIGIAVFHHAHLTDKASSLLESWIGTKWHTQLTFSKFFLGDYILGTLVFLNFAGTRRISERLSPLLDSIERPVRFLARYTLSLYLLHQPLFLFWGAVIRGDNSRYTFWWVTTGLVAGSVFLIGSFTENRRHLLKSWLETQLLWIQTVGRHRNVVRR